MDGNPTIGLSSCTLIDVPHPFSLQKEDAIVGLLGKKSVALGVINLDFPVHGARPGVFPTDNGFRRRCSCAVTNLACNGRFCGEIGWAIPIDAFGQKKVLSSFVRSLGIDFYPLSLEERKGLGFGVIDGGNRIARLSAEVLECVNVWFVTIVGYYSRTGWLVATWRPGANMGINQQTNFFFI